MALLNDRILQILKKINQSEVENKQLSEPGLRFKIKDVTVKGVITVKFNEPILMFDELKKLQESVIGDALEDLDITSRKILVTRCSSPECGPNDQIKTKNELWADI